MPTPSKLAKKVLALALAEVGVEEKPRGSNRGPRVDDYQRATWLDKKDWGAWCAAFIDFCVMKAMEGGKYTFERPQTAGAFDLANWSLKQDNSTQTKSRPGKDIIPGDIVIYTFSHVAFALTAPDSGGNFLAVEGNTNDDGGREGYAVMKHPRNVSSAKSRIRFTV